jgi:hypothetical protein
MIEQAMMEERVVEIPNSLHHLLACLETFVASLLSDTF